MFGVASTLKVGLPQCASEKNDQKGRLRGRPMPSLVPVAAHTARSRGRLGAPPRNRPQRETACWREPDSNPRSHLTAAGGTSIRLTPIERDPAQRPTEK